VHSEGFGLGIGTGLASSQTFSVGHGQYHLR